MGIICTSDPFSLTDDTAQSEDLKAWTLQGAYLSMQLNLHRICYTIVKVHISPSLMGCMKEEISVIQTTSRIPHASCQQIMMFRCTPSSRHKNLTCLVHQWKLIQATTESDSDFGAILLTTKIVLFSRMNYCGGNSVTIGHISVQL